jgi:hypothetical protein
VIFVRRLLMQMPFFRVVFCHPDVSEWESLRIDKIGLTEKEEHDDPTISSNINGWDRYAVWKSPMCSDRRRRRGPRSAVSEDTIGCMRHDRDLPNCMLQCQNDELPTPSISQIPKSDELK